MSRLHDAWCEVTKANPLCCCIGRRNNEAADRDRFQRTLTDRMETFDEAELLRALRHLAHDPAAMDAVNDALDAIERGDA